MSTRTSARLAKTKGKRTKVDTDEIPDHTGRDAGDDYVDSEQEEHKPPPRKRQRTTSKPSKPVVRKKQVRGKQGGLAGLINMPIDIFTEVASYLLPGDILSLARSNKFFRNLLMDRSAIHIWHGAMRNVKALPPCPPGMSEPHYLSLLFSKTCSMCGAPARANMDPKLLVRLCGSCRNSHLMLSTAVPFELLSLVVCSAHTAPAKRKPGDLYVLRGDFKELLAEYEEKKRCKDDGALEAWSEGKRDIVVKRDGQALDLLQFLDTVHWDREQELSDAKMARRSEIERRLKEIGWSEKDMEFGWWSTNPREWHALVSQPKPITDRTWANLQPKLISLLETNRKERQAMERDERKQDRLIRLSKFFLDIKKQGSPALQLKAPNPITRLSSTIPTIEFTHRGPFPSFDHTLDWPIVKNLYETDSTVAELEVKFEENRDEIEALVAEWQSRIQVRFMDVLRDGYETQSETLRPAIITSNTDLPNVSDDLKFLLRADSLFYQAPSPNLDSPKELLSYDTFLMKGLNGVVAHMSGQPRRAPDLDNIHWHPEAHEVARQLLADIGKPDATYLEMKTIGRVFACGKCHETKARNWDEMIEHYLEQEQVYADVQEDLTLSSDAELAYNPIHSPTFLTDEPMITDYASKTLAGGYGIGMGRLQVCKVCKRIPSAGHVLATQSAILKHLLNVHGIAHPEFDVHYAPELFSSGLFGMDDDDDSNDSYSGYYFSGGCQCPFHQMLGGNEYDYGDEDEDDEDEVDYCLTVLSA
ncbi:unnamed protein product [Rhizoctonia solani]|uniref:F-box domain-containing protein n=1 Tax=Rhizoctonia solani TaxID=456999 RepID=A0A8H2WDG6_9AGAM|nr:unnamed protein product [Rhizoctonia solani]